ncbi:MAG: amidohydrolase family protein [Opitutaceae bacterium]|nr:amidohydrolase family protein [Opitutaceae bacterium]
MPPPKPASPSPLTGPLLLLLAACFAATGAGAATLVIRGGRLFDPAAGVLRPVEAVVIEGDRIAAVVPAGQPFTVPAGAGELDARGRYLLPGLIDGHVHLVHILRSVHVTADEIFPLYVAHGVTTVRDTGDEVVGQRLLARSAEEHPGRSPRVFLASNLIDGNPAYHQGVSWPVTDPALVPAYVDDMVAWGVQTFKLYVGTERPVGQAVIREAHRHGKWVTGHLGKYRVQDAVADGIDSIEHIDPVFEGLLPPDFPRLPPLAERLRMPRADLVALRTRIFTLKNQIDFAAPPTRALLDLLVRHGTMVDPTLVVFRNWMLLSDQPEIQQHPDVALIPARLRRFWFDSLSRAGADPETAALRREHFTRLLQLTGELYRAGVPLMAGTDAPVQFCPPGAAMHQELELLVEAGLPPAAALTAATLHNARALNQAPNLGSIEPGKLADLVILDADPLADIRHTRRIHRVVRSGIVSAPAELLRQVPAE